MRYTGRTIVALTAATMAVGAAPAAAETVYGVTGEADGPHLVTFDSATPGTFTSDVEITGLPMGRTIAGVDVRPATLQLTALDDAGQLYVLDAFSGALTAVGVGTGIAGATDIDYNPSVDRVRVVGQNGTGNARANPNTGGPVDADPNTVGTQPDGTLAFAADDANANDVPVVPATAYTNSFPSSQTFPAAATTSQFNLEAGNDVLVQQVPPNAGTLRTIGPLGVNLDGPAAFDVVTDADGTTNRAYAAFGVAGSDATGFYSVNTTSGAATKVGADFPAGRPVRDIAVAPTVPLLLALTERVGQQAITAFPADRPQDAGLNRTAVIGLPAGVRLLGIDQRPANGSLYGLGSDSRIYVVDLLTGRATAVGTGPFTPALSGTDFGFDFNPAVDRIRIVSNAGQNLRVNPDTGVGVVTPPSAEDGAINGTTNSVTASAYTASTRPAPAATGTTLFNLDTTRDVLTRQDPPNAGTQVDVGALNQDLGAVNGYDIAARFNHGFAASGDRLFAVNVAGMGAPAGPANGGAVVSGNLGTDLLSSVVGLAVFDRGLVVVPGAPPADPGTPGTPPGTNPGGTTPPPAVVPRSRSRISYSVSPRRDRRAPFRYTLRGRIVPRGAVPATGAFDGGRVTVRAKRAGSTRTLVTRTARVTSTGRFSVRVSVPKRNLAKGRSGIVRLNLRFNGTDALFSSRAFARGRYR